MQCLSLHFKQQHNLNKKHLPYNEDAKEDKVPNVILLFVYTRNGSSMDKTFI